MDSDVYKEPEEYVDEDFDHIKMSHYEGGIGYNHECSMMLKAIKEDNPKSIKKIRYIHNHKGGITIFVNNFYDKQEVYDLMLKAEDYADFTGMCEECVYAGELTHMVKNSIHFIRNYCEWIWEYLNNEELIRTYLNKFLPKEEYIDAEYITAFDYIFENSLNIKDSTLGTRASKCSKAMDIEIKKIPHPKYGKINAYNKKLLEVISQGS